MKKTLLALSLIGCLVLGMASCITVEGKDDNKGIDTGKQTVVTTEEQKPGATVDGTQEGNSDTPTAEVTQAGGLQQGGANTEGGYGPIHRP